MKVKVKKLDANAQLPFKKYEKDFCYDVVATSCEEILPNVYKYGIGLAFEIERPDDLPDDLQVSIDFRPRSSIYKTGMCLSNCTGTIDEMYRGEVKAVFYHLVPILPKYEVGDRIGQIKIGITEPMEFEVVDELNETSRGEGGFGSTGK